MSKLILSNVEGDAVVIKKVTDDCCDICEDNSVNCFEAESSGNRVCEDCVKQLNSFLKVAKSKTTKK